MISKSLGKKIVHLIDNFLCYLSYDEYPRDPSSFLLKQGQDEEDHPVSPTADIAVDSLTQIADEIAACRACELHQQRIQVVPGVGVENAQVMVIGEAPGENEDKTGHPFVGLAGQMLDKWLNAIDLDRSRNVFITNIVKCRPPRNRDPKSSECQSCIPFLIRQVAIVQPKFILLVGRMAAQHILQQQTSLRSMRQKIHRFMNIPVIVTYHPSAYLRNRQALRLPIWDDLTFLRAQIKAENG